MIRVFFDAVVLDQMLFVLFTIETQPKKWGDTMFKKSLIQMIETLANSFELYLPARLDDTKTNLHNSLKDTAEQMAAATRELIKWIYTPKKDTRQHLINRIASDFICVASGDWDNFPRLTPDKSRPRKVIINRLKAIVVTVTTGTLPILLIYFIHHWIGIDEAIFKSLLIGAYIWAALTILSLLDTSYNSKITILKEVAQLLPIPGRSNK
jgi:hypothetical protein